MNNIDKLLSKASEKLGTNPEELRRALEKGSMNDIIAHLRPDDAKRLKAIAENRSIMEKLFKSPEAQRIINNMK